MKQIECYIVQDLLPLYIDHACSKLTAEDIAGHLQSCENCKELYEEMSSNICSALQASELDSRKIFRHAKKSILAIILALAAVISCFVINTGGAWTGGAADISNMIVTILYVIFWSVFSVLSKEYMPLIKISFAISFITFVSAVFGLISRAFHIGGFITGILSVFSSIPFYGLRFFMDWTGLYTAVAALSLAWLIYTLYSKRALERTTDLKGD